MKPCPNFDCRSMSNGVQSNTGMTKWYCYCSACGVRGPKADDSGLAIRAWDALPRNDIYTNHPTVRVSGAPIRCDAAHIDGVAFTQMRDTIERLEMSVRDLRTLYAKVKLP